jgi:hypothetical protein
MEAKMRQTLARILFCVVTTAIAPAHSLSQQPPLAIKTPSATLVKMAQDLVNALNGLGNPLPQEVQDALRKEWSAKDRREFDVPLQALLDPHCLLTVHINPESRVKVSKGEAEPLLVLNDWTIFLVKVHNQSGTTAPLRLQSPNEVDPNELSVAKRRQQWLQMRVIDLPPFSPKLSGRDLEYRLIALLGKEAGKREAKLTFHVGQGTQDLGFRGETDLLFESQATFPLTIGMRDEDDNSLEGAVQIHDQKGRAFPSVLSRTKEIPLLPPDLSCKDGTTLRLPPGNYKVLCFFNAQSERAEIAVQIDKNLPKGALFRIERPETKKP